MTQTTYHIRVEFSNYEKAYLTEYLQSYLAKVKRHNPLANLYTPNMTSHHDLIMFDSQPQTQISAFQLFQLKIELIHSFKPSEIYFNAYLKDSKLFPNCYHLLNQFQTDDCEDTLLPLSTQNGKFPIPSIYPQHQTKPIILHQLSLNLNMEQLQYSQSPYSTWKQVEAQAGNIHFPDHQSLLHSLPSVQNPPPTFQNHRHPVRWNQRFHPRDPNDYSFNEEYNQNPNTNFQPPFQTPWKNPPPPPNHNPASHTHQDEANQHQQADHNQQHQQNQPVPKNIGTIPKTLTNGYLQDVLQKIKSTLNEHSLKSSQPPNGPEVSQHSTGPEEHPGHRLRPSHQLPRTRQFHPTDFSADLSFSQPQNLLPPVLPIIHPKPPIPVTTTQSPSVGLQAAQSDQNRAALQAALTGLNVSQPLSPPPATQSNVTQTHQAAATTTATAPVTSIQGAPSHPYPPPPYPPLPPSPPSLGSLQSNNVQTFQPPPNYSDIFHDSLNGSRDPFAQPLPPSPNRQVLDISTASTGSRISPPNQSVQQQQRVITPPIAAGPQSNTVTKHSIPVTVVANPKAVAPIVNLPKKRKQNPNLDPNSDKEKAPAVDSRQELDDLNNMLNTLSFDDTNNSFSKHQTPNPNDPSKPTYSLPEYLNPYVLTLLDKINNHPPPDNLAQTLAPFISFDININQYIANPNGLNMRILQKLDKLYNAGRQTPLNIYNRFVNSVLNRSKSQ